jgi:trigger factor
MHDDASTAVADKLAQDVKLEDSGPARKLITIEIPEERIKSKFEDVFGNLTDEAVLPGFRKGRAPRRLLERKFSDSVKKDVQSQLLTESYQQAIEDHKLDVIGEPDVKDAENLKLPESGAMKVQIEVEVSPEVELPDFKTLKITKPSATVSDEDVTKEIESMRERFGRMDSAREADIADGDYVQVDLKVLAGEKAGDDAEALADATGVYTLVHGEKHEYKGHVAGILVNDLGKRLIGKKVGHEERISMTGPASHENDKIKNQPITLVLKLTDIQRLQPAELPALIEQLGVESEDDLKTQVRTMLERRAQARQRTEMHRQAAEQLVEKVKLELPEGVKGRQIQRLLARRRMEMLYAGESPEVVEQKIAEARTESEQTAIQQLKAFFVIDRAAKNLEVNVEANEINGQIAMLAMQQGRRPEKLRQEMMQRGEIEQLYLSIREGKTLDKVIEQAEVTDAA